MAANAFVDALGQRQRPGAYGQLRPAGAPGDQGNLSPVIGPAFLVHGAVNTISGKRSMHGAQRFQHPLPGQPADGTQRGNGIADPQAAFRLMGMLRFRQTIGGQAVAVEIAVQPQRAAGFLAGTNLG